MKTKYKKQLFALLLIATFGAFVFACAEAERDNEYDPKSPNYVFAVYVSTTGIDTPNCGTSEYPCKTIQTGISRAPLICDPKPRQVRVATGMYSGTSPVVTMVNGTSIYGGYGGETIIEDTSVGGGSLNNPNRTIYCGSTITNTTSINGFTILMGKGTIGDEANSSIFCDGSPTISNNKIYGRSMSSDAGHYSIGIYINASAPVIKNNSIDAKWNEDNGAGDISFGIYSNGSSAIIENNDINGGMGRVTYGIYIWVTNTSVPKIRNNVIYAGAGINNTASYGIWNQNNDSEIYNNTIDGGTSTTSRCIHVASGSPLIRNNIFHSASSNNATYGIYEGGGQPYSVRNNDFWLTTSNFYYNTGSGTSGDIANLATTISTGEGDATLSAYNNVYTNPTFVSSTDYHLQTSSTIKQSGIDGSASWGFNYDKDAITRTGNGTTGWSIGAYEQNN